MNDFTAIPSTLGAASPVPPFGNAKTALPLHIVAEIIRTIDDLGDIARLICTCRILYYMGLPELWRRVTLRSYSDIRYIDGRPEGFGSGSPFAMGLATLVTGKTAEYVQSISFAGEWKEWDVDDYSKGRVPDNAMMLNLNVRAAIDKMTRLKEFEWQLNPKLSPQVYAGLAQRPDLRSLTLRFPSSRIPKPMVMIPAIPRLEKLVAYDIDPLAYPDDISTLIVSAAELKSLDMHFNPRIRREAEQSIYLPTYFGKVLAAGRRLRLQHVGLYNLFTSAHNAELEKVFDPSPVTDLCLVNVKSSVEDSLTIFLDSTWQKTDPGVFRSLKRYRGEFLNVQHARGFSKFKGMEDFFFIGKHRQVSRGPPSAVATPETPSSSNSGGSKNSPATKSGLSTISEDSSLPSEYIAVIEGCHGHTMKRLLLSDQWLLEISTLENLVKQLPNLEQLGVATTNVSHETLRSVIPHARKLWAYRQLLHPDSELQQHLSAVDQEMLALMIAYEFWKPEYRTMKVLGMGQQVYKLGGVERCPNGTLTLGTRNGPSTRFLRQVVQVTPADVEYVEIWGMDSGDIKPSPAYSIR